MPRHASAPRFVGEGKIVFAEREYPDPGLGQLLLSVEANAIAGRIASSTTRDPNASPPRGGRNGDRHRGGDAYGPRARAGPCS